MTFNNIIDLFQSIANAHYQLSGFGFGNLIEINGGKEHLKDGMSYPLMWVVPLESITKEQTRERRYLMIICKVGKHDQSDRDEIWSDMEQVFDDVIKILKMESDDYDLINDVVKFPIVEKFADWVTGWQGEVVIETELNSNYCDIPADGLNTPVKLPGYAIVKDQYGNIITNLKPGEIYTIEVLDTIQQSLDTVSPTIIQILS